MRVLASPSSVHLLPSPALDPRSDIAKLIRRLKRLKSTSTNDFYRKWSKLRKELYKTAAYQSFLLEVRTRAMFRCQTCSKPGRHVHHKIRVYDNPDLVVDPNNGAYLCVACHRKEHASEAPAQTPKAERKARVTPKRAVSKQAGVSPTHLRTGAVAVQPSSKK